jgi:hypothetical protein
MAAHNIASWIYHLIVLSEFTDMISWLAIFCLLHLSAVTHPIELPVAAPPQFDAPVATSHPVDVPVEAWQLFDSLPAQTVAAISITDMTEWRASYNKTGLANYFRDERVKSMLAELAGEDDTSLLSIFRDDEFRQLGVRQLTWGLVPGAEKLESTMIFRFDGAAGAQKFIDAIKSRAESGRRRFQATSFGGGELFVVDSGSTPGQQAQSAAVARQGDLICATANPELIRQYYRSSSVRRLSDSKKFQKVVAEPINANEDTFWMYVDPWELLKKLPEPSRATIRNLRIAEQEGFAAIEAIGGTGRFSRASEFRFNGQILCRKPFQRGMRLFNLANSAPETMPVWTAGACNVGYLQIETRRVLDSITTLFDAVVGEGESGVFETVLHDLKQAADGPQVDLQTEIFEQLQPPFFFASYADGPRRRTIVGLKITDVGRVETGLKRFYAGDDRAQPITSVDYPAWKVLPLADNSIGIRQSYVVAAARQYLLIAPDAELLNTAVARDNQAEAAKLVGNASSQASFAYQIDLHSLLQLKHEQLRTDTADGILDLLLQSMQPKGTRSAADRSAWPPFADLPRYLTSQATIRGITRADGWSIELYAGK